MPSQLTINPVNIQTTYKAATLSGMATWFWWFAGSGSRGIVQNIYGSVGLPGSGADLEMADVALTAGEVYRVMNLQLNFPTVWNY